MPKPIVNACPLQKNQRRRRMTPRKNTTVKKPTVQKSENIALNKKTSQPVVETAAVAVLEPSQEKKYKNCDIFMCGANASEESDILEELRSIFERTNNTSRSSRFTRIGVESSNAFALIVKGYRENRIVIKVPRRKNGTVDSLRYEYITGCHIRKTMCKLLPNFMKAYGYVHKYDDEYLILQRVLPGTSFRELIGPTGPKEYCTMRSPILQSLVLQTLCALQMAQGMIGFVHYDLHFGNVLVKKDLGVGSSIEYNYYDRRQKKRSISVPVYDGQVAVIIDYGRARTNESAKHLYANKQLFRPYKFLLKAKHKSVDIRVFDSAVDTRRFCTILTKHTDFEYDDGLMDIIEPHDVIKYILRHYVAARQRIAPMA